MNNKKISFLALIILVFSLNTFYVNALDKWTVLDNFKKNEYELIFESKWLWLDQEDQSVLNTSAKLNIFNNISDSIQEKRQNLETQKEVISKNIMSLEETIWLLDDEIAEATKKSVVINKQIIETKRQIDKNKDTVEILHQKVNKNREILMQYLIYLYKKSNYIYTEKSVDNLKAIIFSWDDISKIINDIHFKSLIEITWKKLIDNHRKYISELYVKTLELWQEQADLKKLRRDLFLSMKLLNDKKEYKNKILILSKWKEALYKKYIEEKLVAEREIKVKIFKEQIKFNWVKDQLLKKYDCKLSELPKPWQDNYNINDKCWKLSKIIDNESKLKWFDTASQVNLFSWPIYPAKWLSAYFQDPGYQADFGSSHDAIDMPTPQWTSIEMPADWYVIYVQRPVSEDYSYVAVKHSDWFVSVYWHLSEVLVNELDFIKKWTVFAKTGWEYWTFWAWIMTTWPHLHFELYRDKQLVDPLNYLDTSILPFSTLPEKYKYKFLTDFKERKWYEYTENNLNDKNGVFVLDWNSELERQQSLIRKYATSEFNNWNMWVEEALDWNIDPSFVMCIWLAETWLWKHLKTPYNIWNVWNTDSWDVKTFESARNWVYSIVKTLNNQYLGWYKKISDLSRYWNKDWSIYASSSENWHNNIIKCMSHLKWVYIPDDYNFRLVR